MTIWNLVITEECFLVNKANLVQIFFLVCLFLFSTCFRRLCAHHHQEKQLYLCETWYLLFCMDHCLVCRVQWINSTLHTRQSSKQNNKYPVSHKYSCFSWWWANNRPKHVEKRNKHTKKNCAPSWLYFRDCIRIHVQQKIKLKRLCFLGGTEWIL